MKKLLTILTLISLNAFATGGNELDYLQETHYSPEFKLQAVKEICPKDANGISCEAIGGSIMIKSNLNNCADSMAFFDAKIVNDDYRKITFVVVYSNAKAPSSAYEIMCVRAPVVIKSIRFSQTPYSDVRVINHFQNKL